MRILLLGGTTEASQMAQRLAEAGFDAVFSYAGRTAHPIAQPLPTRIGGFGGVAGLNGYLVAEGITHVIDATHPFAAGMSRNAHAACGAQGIPLLRLARAPWRAVSGDNWCHFAEIADVPSALPTTPARVFLAIGKQHIGCFTAAPQHHYLLRLVDPPTAPLPLPNTSIVLARGPFDVAGDKALLQTHEITHVVAKNSGGAGAAAKLIAARTLGLPVLMVDRPALPETTQADSVEVAMDWLHHSADLGV